MKNKLFSILFALLLFVPLNSLKAISSEDVNYTISNYYIQSDIDIAGSLNVKELIILDGTFNGYVRDINWSNPKLNKFTGKDKDFEGSSIYNASELVKLKVGTLKLSSTPKFEDMANKIEYFAESDKAVNGDSKKYELSKSKTGYSIKMFNPARNSRKAFYIEYTIPNVVVKHKDVAELYYNFIGEDYTDEIENLEIRTFLPESDSSKNFKIWAHGPLNGSIYKIKDNLGSVLKCTNLPKNTPVDVRMTYDKELFPISINKSKMTDINAADKILKVEKQRADDANNKRKAAKLKVLFLNITCIIYMVLLLVIGVYIYINFDRELKSNFKNKYYREIIDDYPIYCVEYLLNKTITEKTMSASILNLIYKKNIAIEETDKKHEYIFKLKNNKKLSSTEQKLVDLLFNEVGNGESFTSKDLKKAAKTESYYDAQKAWKTAVEAEAEDQNFYYTEDKFKKIAILYGVIGIVLFIINMLFDIWSLYPIFALILTIFFIFYIILLKKRTEKGNEDYHKWKAFKNYLKDFGRFDEKDLPEIKLWERLLVYAAVFGITKEVQKSMKLKLEQIDPNSNYISSNTMFNYFLYTNLVHDVEVNVHNTMSAAQAAETARSSGSGSGGGFSSGGGFGGGGGGGHGF